MNDLDLRAGMYVELANGLSGILVPWHGKLMVIGKCCVDETKFSALAEPRLYDRNHKEDDYSIVKVYSDCFSNGYDSGGCFSTDGRSLLWKYESYPKELTVREIEERLGYKIKIVEG